VRGQAAGAEVWQVVDKVRGAGMPPRRQRGPEEAEEPGEGETEVQMQAGWQVRQVEVPFPCPPAPAQLPPSPPSCPPCHSRPGTLPRNVAFGAAQCRHVVASACVTRHGNVSSWPAVSGRPSPWSSMKGSRGKE